MSASRIVAVRVKPGSRKGPLVTRDTDSRLTVHVAEPAVDGKANRAVIQLLAQHFGVPRSHVELTSGAAARLKFFRITSR